MASIIFVKGPTFSSTGFRKSWVVGSLLVMWYFRLCCIPIPTVCPGSTQIRDGLICGLWEVLERVLSLGDTDTRWLHIGTHWEMLVWFLRTRTSNAMFPRDHFRVKGGLPESRLSPPPQDAALLLKVVGRPQRRRRCRTVHPRFSRRGSEWGSRARFSSRVFYPGCASQAFTFFPHTASWTPASHTTHPSVTP